MKGVCSSFSTRLSSCVLSSPYFSLSLYLSSRSTVLNATQPFRHLREFRCLIWWMRYMFTSRHARISSWIGKGETGKNLGIYRLWYLHRSRVLFLSKWNWDGKSWFKFKGGEKFIFLRNFESLSGIDFLGF